MTHIDDDAVLWSADEGDRAGRPLLVLLHGYGSHEGDLFGLSPYLPLTPAIASLRGPLPQPPGHAWYPLTGRATASGAVGTDLGPPELNGGTAAVDDATTALGAWIDANAADTPVALLGFSQGGAMALQLMRTHPHRFACAVVLSGFAIERPEPGDDELARRRPPVFWGRGTADAVVADDAVRHTSAWLESHTSVDARTYDGLGHSVSQAELADVGAFLHAYLG